MALSYEKSLSFSVKFNHLKSKNLYRYRENFSYTPDPFQTNQGSNYKEKHEKTIHHTPFPSNNMDRCPSRFPSDD